MSHSLCSKAHARTPDLGQRLLVNPRLLVHMLSRELFPAPTEYLTGWLMIRKCVAEQLGCSIDTAGSLVVLLEGKGFVHYELGPEDPSAAVPGHWMFIPDPERRARQRGMARRRAG